MLRKSQGRPKFKTEVAEADWWASPEGKRYTQREFERALREDAVDVNPRGLKVRRTDPKVISELLERAKQRATRPISLRLSLADIEQAKRIAARRGIGYQTVLKEAIRKGLRKSA